jgi:hypothetical protein
MAELQGGLSQRSIEPHVHDDLQHYPETRRDLRWAVVLGVMDIAYHNTMIDVFAGCGPGALPPRTLQSPPNILKDIGSEFYLETVSLNINNVFAAHRDRRILLPLVVR